MKSPDPTSLQNLNDIVLPAQVSWWPLAAGWYFLIGLLLIVLAWYGYRSIRLWLRNRYRRAALQELRQLAENLQNENDRESSLRQIPVLLKRTALSAYPRTQVASLVGGDWHEFLNSTLKQPAFTKPVFSTLETVSYSTGQLDEVDAGAAIGLLDASQIWLKHHQSLSAAKESRES